MKYLARVEVKLKTGHSDVEGDTAAEALRDLGYGIVGGIRVGRVYRIELEAKSSKEAEEKVKEMCRRHLANPVRDDYNFEIEEVK